jgi:uncharacterized membrane protein
MPVEKPLCFRHSFANFDDQLISRSMEPRPRLKIKWTLWDRITEAACVLVLIVLVAAVIFSYERLPARIPIHYNGSGVADGFGDKAHIFSLPAVAILIYAGMTVLNRYPHIYNYPTPVTAENARLKYTWATRLIRALKLITIITFSLIAFKTISTL